MALKLARTVKTPIRRPLFCDPALRGCNSQEALVAYAAELDVSVLEKIPDDVTWVTIKPLSFSERSEAQYEHLEADNSGIREFRIAGSLIDKSLLSVEEQGETWTKEEFLELLDGAEEVEGLAAYLAIARMIHTASILTSKQKKA